MLVCGPKLQESINLGFLIYALSLDVQVYTFLIIIIKAESKRKDDNCQFLHVLGGLCPSTVSQDYAIDDNCQDFHVLEGLCPNAVATTLHHVPLLGR